MASAAYELSCSRSTYSFLRRLCLSRVPRNLSWLPVHGEESQSKKNKEIEDLKRTRTTSAEHQGYAARAATRATAPALT